MKGRRFLANVEVHIKGGRTLFKSPRRGLKIDSRACHNQLRTLARDNRAGIGHGKGSLLRFVGQASFEIVEGYWDITCTDRW